MPVTYLLDGVVAVVVASSLERARMMMMTTPTAAVTPPTIPSTLLSCGLQVTRRHTRSMSSCSLQTPTSQARNASMVGGMEVSITAQCGKAQRRFHSPSDDIFFSNIYTLSRHSVYHCTAILRKYISLTELYIAVHVCKMINKPHLRYH